MKFVYSFGSFCYVAVVGAVVVGAVVVGAVVDWLSSKVLPHRCLTKKNPTGN